MYLIFYSNTFYFYFIFNLLYYCLFHINGHFTAGPNVRRHTWVCWAVVRPLTSDLRLLLWEHSRFRDKGLDLRQHLSVISVSSDYDVVPIMHQSWLFPIFSSPCQPAQQEVETMNRPGPEFLTHSRRLLSRRSPAGEEEVSLCVTVRMFNNSQSERRASHRKLNRLRKLGHEFWSRNGQKKQNTQTVATPTLTRGVFSDRRRSGLHSVQTPVVPQFLTNWLRCLITVLM